MDTVDGVLLVDADAGGWCDWNRGGTWELPTDMNELREYLAKHGMTTDDFKKTMIYTRNVDKIPGLRDL